jgi:hypothetical protein
VAQSSRSQQLNQLATVPAGEELARFGNYPDAKKAIDTLLEGGLPPRALSIVGEGLRSVERVTARYGHGRAALSSALTGSWVGLFVGLIVVTLGVDMTLAPIAAGIVVGAGLGMIIGMALYSSQRANRPTFRSMHQVIAAEYVVVVDPEHQGKARSVLKGNSGQ